MTEQVQIQGVDSSKRSSIADKQETTGSKTNDGAKPTKMTERERLQASLRQTLTEFQEQKKKEKSNGQAAQGGQKAANNRLVGNYLVGKTIGSGTFGKVREGIH